MSNADFSFLSAKGDGTLIAVRVQPRAAGNGFSGVTQGRLKVRVCAPPVEGEANKACVNFLAEVLRVAKSEITLVRGAQSRQKTFLVTKPPDFVREKLIEAGL